MNDVCIRDFLQDRVAILMFMVTELRPPLVFRYFYNDDRDRDRDHDHDS